MLLLPFISITSHQNSSPTEVATVPLAIKIMLGHAMVVCDSTVGNKSSGSSSNDASGWVVNLEQCRQNPSLWFLGETERGPRLHVSVWASAKNIKTRRQQGTASSSSPSFLAPSQHSHNTKRVGGLLIYLKIYQSASLQGLNLGENSCMIIRLKAI